MEDYISQLNLYAQKQKLPLPIYTFTTYDTGFVCVVDFNKGFTASQIYKSKKEAKENAARLVWDSVTEEDKNHIILQDILLLIDGDQRSDVVKWLETMKIPESFQIEIFVSPVSSLETEDKRFKIYVAKSTSKDSTDAALLIRLGEYHTVIFERKNVIIVSSDHILVQAAIDYGHQYAKNLKELKKIICSQ